MLHDWLPRLYQVIDDDSVSVIDDMTDHEYAEYFNRAFQLLNLNKPGQVVTRKTRFTQKEDMVRRLSHQLAFTTVVHGHAKKRAVEIYSSKILANLGLLAWNYRRCLIVVYYDSSTLLCSVGRPRPGGCEATHATARAEGAAAHRRRLCVALPARRPIWL